MLRMFFIWSSRGGGIRLGFLLLQEAQKSYFCQDNNSFGELEAKVFCRMLGWPLGFPIAKSKSFDIQDNLLLKTVDCQGDELHILDCDNKIISKVILFYLKTNHDIR